MQKFIKKLQKECAGLTLHDEKLSPECAVELSKARSLDRIADALEKLVNHKAPLSISEGLLASNKNQPGMFCVKCGKAHCSCGTDTCTMCGMPVYGCICIMPYKEQSHE